MSCSHALSVLAAVVAMSCTPSSGTTAIDLSSCGSITTIVSEQNINRASSERMVSIAYTRSDLDSMLARLYPDPASRPRVSVDFERESVVLAELGVRSTGGYDVVVKCVQGIPEGVRVVIEEWSPGASCIVTTSLTRPFHLARTPRLPGVVLFEWLPRVRECD